MVPRITSAAVLGAGSWGTALAIQLARNGLQSQLWTRQAAHAEDINASACNKRYLPGISLPPAVRATSDLGAALAQAELVLLAVPSDAFRETLDRARPHLRDGQGLAWACKGFEPGTGRLLHQVATELLAPGEPLAVVTGPSFALEVARGLPTALTVAGEQERFTAFVAACLHGQAFRVYTSLDIVGAELGGAIKNVMAIATGICDGMALGSNARAALITRGLAEMMRLATAMGARPDTLMGLTGLGDLVLTCTGDLSRNRRLGLALGQGQPLAAALAGIGQAVEGVGAASEVWRLAQVHGVSMPISEQVERVIHGGVNPRDALQELLAREQKAESTPLVA